MLFLHFTIYREEIIQDLQDQILVQEQDKEILREQASNLHQTIISNSDIYRSNTNTVRTDRLIQQARLAQQGMLDLLTRPHKKHALFSVLRILCYVYVKPTEHNERYDHNTKCFVVANLTLECFVTRHMV